MSLTVTVWGCRVVRIVNASLLADCTFVSYEVTPSVDTVWEGPFVLGGSPLCSRLSYRLIHRPSKCCEVKPPHSSSHIAGSPDSFEAHRNVIRINTSRHDAWMLWYQYSLPSSSRCRLPAVPINQTLSEASCKSRQNARAMQRTQWIPSASFPPCLYSNDEG